MSRGRKSAISGVDHDDMAPEAGQSECVRERRHRSLTVPSVTGGLRTTAIVKVLVTDVNDNRPIFYPTSYNVSLSSGKIGQSATTPIVAVAATDLDSGKFGTVTYQIVSGNENSLFRIDRNTGELFVVHPSLLSSRSQSRYRLNVSAADGTGLASESDAVVYVSVTDSSRGPPVFERAKYKFTVREDARRDTVVGEVKATHGFSGKDSSFLAVHSSFRAQNRMPA